MILYNIVFASGRVVQEYGDNEQDVAEFLQRSFSSYGPVVSIMPF